MKQYSAIIPAILSASLLLASCTKIPTAQEQYGIVSFGLGAQSIVLPVTKAAVPVETLNNFTISVPGTDVKGTYSSIAGKIITLPLGEHTAVAYYPGENPDEAKRGNGGYGEMHFRGESAFTADYLLKTVSIACTPDNSSVQVRLSDKFKEVFNTEATFVQIAEDKAFTSRLLDMYGTNGGTNGEKKLAYFSKGDRVSLKVQTCWAGSSDNPMIFEKPDCITAESGYAYTITVDVAGKGITFTVNGTDTVTGDTLRLGCYTYDSVTEDN